MDSRPDFNKKQKKGMKKQESDRKVMSILVTTYARTVITKEKYI
ncbi:MAG: hypothetical protein QN716_08900 [Nitrososphaeraceae archaeon]|nr:hypothetical protein [Nitrososphaeraceae archaeon]